MHPDRATDVYVADTVGEMGLFYRLANIVLMGGTLVPIGGHNLIEPAKLGAAILHGPHVHSATEIYAAIDQARGALMVKDSHRARQPASRANPALTRDMARGSRRRAGAGRRRRPYDGRSSPSSCRRSSGRGADARPPSGGRRRLLPARICSAP